MRYNSYINNIKSKEWGLNIQQAYLFSWFYELPSWANHITLENEIYYFASKNKACEELPLLTNKLDTMYRYYKQLEEKGLIIIKKVDGKDYVSLTKLAKQWNSKSEDSEINPNTLGNLSESNSEINPTNNNTNIYNNNKENNKKEKFLKFYSEIKNSFQLETIKMQLSSGGFKLDYELMITDFINYCIITDCDYNKASEFIKHFFNYFKTQKKDKYMVPDDTFDYNAFLTGWNKLTKDIKNKQQFLSIEEKNLISKAFKTYSSQQITNALQMAKLDKMHVDNNYIHLTIKHLFKDENLAKYVQAKKIK